MTILGGSCCCGAIRFELSEPPSMMATCHCSRCRKVGASCFAFVRRDAFKLLQGADEVGQYLPETGYTYVRCFCKRCGTALGEIGSTEETFPVNVNCFDDDLGIKVRFHEFVEEKPGWYQICDDAKQFARHPVKS